MRGKFDKKWERVGFALCTLFLSVCTFAGDGIWINDSWEPTSSPKIVARWKQVQVESGVETSYFDYHIELASDVTVSRLRCTANFTARYPITDGNTTYYLWSNSSNWDSITLTLTHIKDVYEYLENGWGDLIDETITDKNYDKVFNDLVQHGPNNQSANIDISDAPFIPDNISVTIGTNLIFDVNIDLPYTVYMDQDSTIQSLNISGGAELVANFGKQFSINENVTNLSTFVGNISRIGGKLTNEMTGNFNGSAGTVEGGIQNDGMMTLTGGYIKNGIINNNTLNIVGSVTIKDFIRGTECIYGSDLSQVFLETDDADTAFTLDCDLESHGTLLAEHGFAGNRTIYASGQFEGKIAGKLVVNDGNHLISYGRIGTRDVSLQVTDTGNVQIKDNANYKIYSPFTNQGNIEVLSGGQLQFDGTKKIQNEGTINVSNSSKLYAYFHGGGTNVGYDPSFVNSGTINIDDHSTFEFNTNYSYIGHIYYRNLQGTGSVQLTNNSQMINPYISSQSDITVDSTSEIIFDRTKLWTDPIYSGYSVISGYLIADTIHNNGTINSYNDTRVRIQTPLLVNNGQINLNYLYLNADQIIGSGSITVDNFLKVENPTNPIRLGQQLTVDGSLHLTDSGIETTDTGKIISAGFITGRLAGKLELMQGKTLTAINDYWDSFFKIDMNGSVKAEGNNTKFKVTTSFTNNGTITISDGATFEITSIHSASNTGSITIRNATFNAFVMGNGSYVTEDTRFYNTGQVILDNSTLKFDSNCYHGNTIYRRDFYGPGTLSLQNNSQIINPRINGLENVSIDSTSSVIVDNIQFSYFRHDYTLLAANTIQNDGSINVYADCYPFTINADTLTNNGVINISSETHIQANRLKGTGTIVANNAHYLHLEGKDENPITIDGSQRVEFNNVNVRTNSYGIVTGDNSKLLGYGTFSGKFLGNMESKEGHNLTIFDSDIEVGSNLSANGTNTSLKFAHNTQNKGNVNIQNGAKLVIPYNENGIVNTGQIFVNSAYFYINSNWDEQNYGMRNDGTITLSNSTMKFDKEFYRGGNLNHIAGKGIINITNNSTVINPVFWRINEDGHYEYMNVYLDRTSSIVIHQQIAPNWWVEGFALNVNLTSFGELDMQDVHRTIPFHTLNLLEGEIHASGYNCELAFTGDFIIALTDPDDFDIGNVPLVFKEGTADDPNLLEILPASFHIHKIIISEGSYLKLVNYYSNTSSADPAALGPSAPIGLYVDELILEDNAILNTSGYNLYYDTLTMGEGAQIIPEPVSLLLFMISLLYIRIRG